MPASFSRRLHHLLPARLNLSGTAPNHSTDGVADWIHKAAQDVVEETLDGLLASPASEWLAAPQIASSLLVGLIRRQKAAPVRLETRHLALIQRTYPELVASPTLPMLVLRLCISSGSNEAVSVAVRLLVDHDAIEPQRLIEVFGDLLRLKSDAVAEVFPPLLKGLDHPGQASLVLDYANFTYRNGLLSIHPAATKVEKLTSLLSNLADRLGHLQDARPKSNKEALNVGKQVTDSVALGIPLCDALANIGDPRAIACLNKVLQIEHRRLRVEAAAALAKLGVEDAKRILTAMAAEPSERLRVLAYAEELDLLDQVDDEFANIAAQAEAEFVMYLAQPSQVGIAPQHIELVDQREMAWPGFDEPRNCFLFQYVYELPTGAVTNIGIAGPVVMTFDADLTVLSFEDVYSLFAGWHVQHQDIHAVNVDRVVGQDEIHVATMSRFLEEIPEYEDVTPILMGLLLERRFLVATAQKEGEPGWVVASDDFVGWVAIGNPQSPLNAMDVFHLYVGRSLLRCFNE